MRPQGGSGTVETPALIRGITRRHVIALAVVVFLATLGQGLIQLVQSRQRNDASVINQAGRQRMLSQRLVQMSLRAVNPVELSAPSPSKQAEKLRELTDEWAHAHLSLRKRYNPGIPGSLNSPEITHLFASIDGSHGAMIQAVGQLCDLLDEVQVSPTVEQQEDLEACLGVVLDHEDGFLQGMEAIVLQLQKEAERQLSIVRKVEFGLYLFLIVMLLAVVIFVYRPMVEQVRSTFHQLCEVREDLRVRNMNLLEALTQAEKATRTKDLFLANMSHEIRTPLNALLGMTAILQKTRVDDYQRECLETISTSGDTLLALIDDLLDLSKIEAGQLELERVPFRPTQALEEAMHMVGERATRKGLELVLHMDRAVETEILGDVNRFRQVVLNLLSNAVKFTERGEVIVRVQIQPRLQGEDHPWLEVQVHDTGIGIAEDRLAKVFEPFVQADSTIPGRYGGTGLGLAICRRLVQGMGGELTVQSTVGVGSTFLVKIPAEAPEEATSNSGIITVASQAYRGRSALLVEDHSIARRAIREMLESWGLNCWAVAGVAEARELLKVGRDQEPWDLVIIDLFLGQDRDGLGLVHRLREDPIHAKVPVIVLDEPENRKRPPTWDQSKTRRVIKPVLSKSLARAVHALLRERVEGHEAEPSHGAEPTTEQLIPVDGRLGQLNPLRILLAEDAPPNQKVLRFMLNRLGYREVEVVSDGRQAIEAIHRRHFDVILMDVQMPEMDGLTATRELCKQFDESRRPWIIALTANALAEDRKRCLAAGMDQYLSKPVRTEALAQALAFSPQLGFRDPAISH